MFLEVNLGFACYLATAESQEIAQEQFCNFVMC